MEGMGMNGTAAQPIDVDSFLDGLKFNRFHLTVLILCTMLTAIDGYELYVVGWVLPKLAKDFGVARTAITSAMMAQQVGMLLGAFVIPPLADRIGRPRVLLFCYARHDAERAGDPAPRIRCCRSPLPLRRGPVRHRDGADPRHARLGDRAAAPALDDEHDHGQRHDDRRAARGR
jgi:hypothetical protein